MGTAYSNGSADGAIRGRFNGGRVGRMSKQEDRPAKVRDIKGEARVTDADVEAIIRDHKSKEYHDLRDRAAYMYVTGSFPSHLRTFFTRVLSMISRYHSSPGGLDGSSGNQRIDDMMVGKLELEKHPMVMKVREYVDAGWRIQLARGANERKPFSKVFLWKGRNPTYQITVQIDGSVLDHW